MHPDSGFISIGKVVRAQGIKGLLRIKPFADAELFESLKDVYVGRDENAVKPYRVVSSQFHNGAILLGLDGIETMTDAEKLIGRDIFTEKDALEKLPEGEYYQFQIIGLETFTEDGRHLGRIEEIFSAGSSDIYVVREGAREYLIPAIADVVKEIDIAAGRVIISPMKGLLGEE